MLRNPEFLKDDEQRINWVWGGRRRRQREEKGGTSMVEESTLSSAASCSQGDRGAFAGSQSAWQSCGEGALDPTFPLSQVQHCPPCLSGVLFLSLSTRGSRFRVYLTRPRSRRGWLWGSPGYTHRWRILSLWRGPPGTDHCPHCRVPQARPVEAAEAFGTKCGSNCIELFKLLPFLTGQQ